MKESITHLKKENEALQLRLTQAEELLEAIQNGDVDAIVMNGLGGEKIFSLNSAETPYRVLIEKMSEGAVIISQDGVILYCNQRFADMFQESMEQIIGSDFLRFIDSNELPEYGLLLKSGVSQGFSKELKFTSKHKKTSFFYLSFSPLPLEIMRNIYLIVTDITELKEKENKIKILNTNLEEKILERTLQLEASNKELESFSYSVSHDLRAPLRAVNSYAQIMIENHGKNVDEDGLNLLESIRYNGEKMGRLIDELLSFSKLGRKELELETVNMDQLIKRVITDLGEGNSIHAAIKLSPLPFVQSDNSMLYLIFYNLLSNAIKYSSKKEYPVIEVFSQQKNNKEVFVVKDNGAGFDMQYADKLFGIFQRLHSQKEFEGNCVGLATVHRIITKFGGIIWAEAKENEGATFYFTLN
ncbi:MAG: ATP-binding protein [Sediminibacterium sp.]|nr:ATP-binding protein [Sediminibacterium sp.]